MNEQTNNAKSRVKQGKRRLTASIFKLQQQPRDWFVSVCLGVNHEKLPIVYANIRV